jgi:hypothetical protein
VTATASGVSASTTVHVLPDALATIVVSGPSSLVVATSGSYTAFGFDRYGNPVPVAPTWTTTAGSVDANGVLTAPTKTGVATVAAAEGGVVGSTDVQLLPGAVAEVVVQSPTSVTNVERPVALAARAFDAFGNAVAASPSAWSATSGDVTATGLFTPTEAGTSTVSALVDGVAGSYAISVTDRLTTAVATAQSAYLPTDALANGVFGAVHVAYVDGSPVVGAQVTVKVTQVSPLGTLRSSTFATGVTDATGTLVFQVPQAFALPGDYQVTASAIGEANLGQGATTYSVGA